MLLGDKETKSDNRLKQGRWFLPRVYLGGGHCCFSKAHPVSLLESESPVCV